MLLKQTNISPQNSSSAYNLLQGSLLFPRWSFISFYCLLERGEWNSLTLNRSELHSAQAAFQWDTPAACVCSPPGHPRLFSAGTDAAGAGKHTKSCSSRSTEQERRQINRFSKFVWSPSDVKRVTQHHTWYCYSHLYELCFERLPSFNYSTGNS